jgi:Predicted membrane protein
MTERRHHDRGLFALALFKMAKAVLLFLAGAGALSLLRPAEEAKVREWLSDLTIRQGHRFVERALHLLNVASPRQMTLVALASICYGLLFATEGIGLWMEKRWAEWLTIVATGSLIPFEIYELARALTPVRTLALVANVAAVIYLIFRLRHPTGDRRELH